MTPQHNSAYEKLPRKSRGSFSTWGYAATLFFIFALYTWLSQITPLSLDDWEFMGIWRDDTRGNWPDYYSFIRGFDNGRLANGVSPFSTTVWPWKEAFPLLTGALLAFTVAMSARFANGSVSFISLSLTWALMIIGLPWRDTIFVRDYSLNYIWSAAFTLGLLWLLQSGEKKGWSLPKFVAAAVLAVVAGGWHESFAVATLCGLLLLMMARRFRMSARFFLVVAVYMAATLCFMLSPGMLRRIGSAIETTGTHVAPSSIFIGGILVCVLIVSLIFPKGRRLLAEARKSDTVIVAAGIFTAGYAIAIFTVKTARAFFWPDLAAVVIIVWWIMSMAKTASSSLETLAGSILALLCIGQTLSVIFWQNRYSADTTKIMAMLEHSDSGTVYYDSPYPAKPPFYTFGIPVANMWRNASHYRALWSYYMKPTLGVVPRALSDASLEDAQPLPGGYYLFGEAVIAKFDKTEFPAGPAVPFHKVISTSLPSGAKEEGYRLVVPFVTDRGDTLVYFAR